MNVRINDGRLVVENVMNRNGDTDYVERRDITVNAINGLFEIFAKNPKFVKEGVYTINHIIGKKDDDTDIMHTLALIGDDFTIVQNSILAKYMTYKKLFEESQQGSNKTVSEYEKKIEELTTEYNKQVSELKERLARYEKPCENCEDAEYKELDAMAYTE